MKRKFISVLLLLLLCPVTDIISKGEGSGDVISKIVVYLIGDSTCANKNENKRPETGWGEKLQQFLNYNQVAVDNRAIDGRSSKSFIAEGRWESILTTLKAGDWVFIQFGHNDQYKGEDNNVWSTVDAYKTNLRRYVNETRSKGANPVILTSIVRRQFTGDVLNQSLGEYPSAARAIAVELSVPLIDMEAKTRAVVSEMGPENSKELYMWVNRDDTHLNSVGAERFASLVIEGIRELNLEPLATNIITPEIPIEETLYEWDFGNDRVTFPETIGYSADTTIAGLTIHPGTAFESSVRVGNVAAVGYSASLSGITYTHRLTLNGQGYWAPDMSNVPSMPASRYLSFNVTGNSVITAHLSGAYSSEFHVYVTDGTRIVGQVDPVRQVVTKYTINYSGPATTLYLFANTNGVDFFYLKIASSTTGIQPNPVDKGAIRSISYYDVYGRQVSAETRGILIKKVIYESGLVETGKVLAIH